MGKWRDAFEERLPPSEARDYGAEYIFAPPASENQLAAVEEKLGVRLADDLRDMLREFNGIRKSTVFSRDSGASPSPLFLDTSEIAAIIDTPEMNDMILDREELLDHDLSGEPFESDLRRVAFFWQSNGMADLYGVSSEQIGEFPAGSVMRFDHEASGEILAGFRDLLSFVRSDRSK